MNILLTLLVVAITQVATVDSRAPETIEVFRCVFDVSWDENFDKWPDNWTRRRGLGFPSYVRIYVSNEPSPIDNRCLRIDLNGGGGIAYSPPIQISTFYGYVLEGQLATENLNHDQAFFSLSFLDKDRHLLQTVYSKKINNSNGWKKLRVGPASPKSSEAMWAVIGLHLQPGNSVQPGARSDLFGSAMFDDIRLGRLPRVSLSANSSHHIYTNPKDISIKCRASGFTQKAPRITFELEDISGKLLAQVSRPLFSKTVADSTSLSLDSFSEEAVGLVGDVKWIPPIPGCGFYRIRATMKEQARTAQRRELTIVVVDPQPNPTLGEFGWSLPNGNKPLPLQTLGEVLGHVGINWLKYPLWYGKTTTTDADIGQLLNFSERLSSQGIDLVGLLNRPPTEVRSHFGDQNELQAADIFTAKSDIWYPTLEPIMTRLATRVRWWQLGCDTDTSFVGYPDLNTKFTEIKNTLSSVRQDVNLGIGWGWLNELPPIDDEKTPYQFLNLSASPVLTHEELATYLASTKRHDLKRWAIITPLSKKEYPLDVRAEDLAQRMMAAKIHQADAIFVPNPFDDDRGLCRKDGTPGELLLPWRTIAMSLAGSTYIGAIQLPNGSDNQIFAHENDAVMVVWNDIPTEEVLYLGKDVRQIDLWARSVAPPKKGHKQIIRVGKLPTVITGLNKSIAQLRMGLSFDKTKIPSVFGKRTVNSLRIKNYFPSGVGGQATLVTPKTWIVENKTASFQLAANETWEREFSVILPYNASSGSHRVNVDFEIQADHTYRFSVYRTIHVGLGGVYITIGTALNDEGQLEVQQQFINDTDKEVNFRCQLLAPNRRLQKSQIIGLGRGRDIKVYRLPNGKELIGKTLWLRGEELDGARVLNYRIIAKP